MFDRILHKLDHLQKGIAAMALDLTKLHAATAAIEAKLAAQSAQIADLTAKVNALPPGDPADQAAVDAAADKLAQDAAA